VPTGLQGAGRREAHHPVPCRCRPQWTGPPGGSGSCLHSSGLAMCCCAAPGPSLAHQCCRHKGFPQQRWCHNLRAHTARCKVSWGNVTVVHCERAPQVQRSASSAVDICRPGQWHCDGKRASPLTSLPCVCPQQSAEHSAADTASWQRGQQAHVGAEGGLSRRSLGRLPRLPTSAMEQRLLGSLHLLSEHQWLDLPGQTQHERDVRKLHR
jgi:hypothetical protein